MINSNQQFIGQEISMRTRALATERKNTRNGAVFGAKVAGEAHQCWGLAVLSNDRICKNQSSSAKAANEFQHAEVA
jgi:hypothetical protein